MKNFILLLCVVFAWTATAKLQIFEGPVSIGDKNKPANGLALSVQTKTKSSKPCPDMTELERDALTPAVPASCVYNTDTLTVNFYDGSDWVEVGAGSTIEEWETAKAYGIGAVIYTTPDYKLWIANTAHTSGATFIGDIANWDELSPDKLPIVLTTDVSGILPVANGGTNNSTALTNNLVMISSVDTITESTITTTELGYLDGVTSLIQGQIDDNVTDIGTNSTNIATNAGDISTNVTNINTKMTKIVSTDNTLPRFNGVDGEVQSSTVSVSDSGALSADSISTTGNLEADGSLLLPSLSAGTLQVDGSGVVTSSIPIPSTTLTTKGDIQSFSTENAALPIGTDGQKLVVDSLTATGLKWIASIGEVVSNTIQLVKDKIIFLSGIAVQSDYAQPQSTGAIATKGSLLLNEDTAYIKGAEGNTDWDKVLTEKDGWNVLITEHFEGTVSGYSLSATCLPDYEQVNNWLRLSLKFICASENFTLTGTSGRLAGLTQQGLASVYLQTPDDNVQIIIKKDGVADVTYNVPKTDTIRRFEIPFSIGATNNALEIKGTGVTGNVYIDNAKLGIAPEGYISNVDTSRFVGKLSQAKTACSWGRSSSTWGAFAAVADCDEYSIEGDLVAPPTKIPAISITNARTDGYYSVRGAALLYATTAGSACSFSLSTTSSLEPAQQTLEVLEPQNRRGYALEGDFKFSSGGTKTIQIISRSTNSSHVCSVFADGNQGRTLTWSVHFYPDLPNTLVGQKTSSPDEAGFLQLSFNDGTLEGFEVADGGCVLKSKYPDYVRRMSSKYASCTITVADDGILKPDARGYFFRGLDNMGTGAASRDVDGTARTVGQTQTDQFKSHNHTINRSNSSGHSTTQTDQIADNATSIAGITNSNLSGGTETRGKNIAVMAYVRMVDRDILIGKFNQTSIAKDEDKYTETEKKWGFWKGEQLYRRCFTVANDVATSGVIAAWVTGLKIKNAIHRTGNKWTLQGVEEGANRAIIDYLDDTGNIEATVSTLRVAADTSICAEYTK